MDAGAIAFDSAQNKYVRLPDDSALELAVQKLKLERSQPSEWLVSSPGKVILFGEHAVVHGVVSVSFSVFGVQGYDAWRLPLRWRFHSEVR